MMKIVCSLLGVGLWMVGCTFAFGLSSSNSRVLAVGVVLMLAAVTLFWRSSNEDLTSVLLYMLGAYGCLYVIAMFISHEPDQTTNAQRAAFGVLSLGVLFVLKRQWRRSKVRVDK